MYANVSLQQIWHKQRRNREYHKSCHFQSSEGPNLLWRLRQQRLLDKLGSRSVFRRCGVPVKVLDEAWT